MKETLTFTARGIDDPRQVTTLTLHDHLLSVGSGPPIEQFDRASIERVGDFRLLRGRLWLRPLALSLLQRESGAFPVSDVLARLDEDYLAVKLWLRAGGLRVVPVTLVDGRIDNPQAATAFVAKLTERQGEADTQFDLLRPFDYWITWILAGLISLATAIFLLRRHRRRR